MILGDAVYSSKIEAPTQVIIEPRQLNQIKFKAETRRGLFQSLYLRFLKDSEHGVRYTALELKQIFQEALTKDTQLKNNAKATVKLQGWKGKSTIDIIERPDSFLVITYERADQDHEPNKQEHIITKEDINYVIACINILNVDKETKIKTRDIAEKLCRLRNIKVNREDKDLFPNGSFNWQLFFSDRALHLHLNLCLRILDNFLLIKYRAGKSQVLKEVTEIDKKDE